MEVRIKATNRLGVFYTSYKKMSMDEINKLKITMSQDFSFKTSLLMEGHYMKEKEFTIIPKELMKETVITIECRDV